jgi:hypothetical protein
MEDYLQFWQRTLAATPLANSEFSKKLARIASRTWQRVLISRSA